MTDEKQVGVVMRKGSIPCSNPCASIDSSQVSNTDEKKERVSLREAFAYDSGFKAGQESERVRHEKELKKMRKMMWHYFEVFECDDCCFKDECSEHHCYSKEQIERVFGKVKKR